MTQEEAKAYFDYDPITGIFIKKRGRGLGPYEGFKSTQGYRKVYIEPHEYFMHRLAFLIMTGDMPEQVDHINRNKEDNRWENLRATNNILNQTNTKTRAKSGFKGVRLTSSGKWEAAIDTKVKGDRTYYYLGLYLTFEEACEAVTLKAKDLYGEHWRNA